MTTNRRFSLALRALAELKTGASAPHPDNVPRGLPQPISAAPDLRAVLADIGPLPPEALFLGVASDGLPVLLNLRDPHPGPMLIAGDAAAGKTVFLQTIAYAAAQTHTPDDVQYGVITTHPDEWVGLEDTPHRVGVFAVHDASAQDLVLSLASWAHANKQARQSVLLLIDDLEAIAGLDSDSLQNFRWLLLRGPARRVWPLITLNAARYGQVLAWLQIFRTRVFGRIADERVAAALGADRSSALDQLEARIQFSLRENGNWLRFWLPSF
ncbi:MAG TPA: FtsK/SpoIIIE domain-containing protein [Anaerolineales bacterium]|nr:FtsK/SpoIIIE domain-containing protein [Anaerolineales bacterium]